MKRIAISAILLLTAAAAVAQPAPPPRHDSIVRELALTDAQRTAWREAHEATRTEIEPLVAQQRAAHEQLRATLDGGSKDANAIGAQMLSIHATGEQIKAAHETLRARLLTILTAEQREKFEAIHAAREAGRERGRGPLAGTGPMPGRGPMRGRAPAPGRGPGF